MAQTPYRLINDKTPNIKGELTPEQRAHIEEVKNSALGIFFEDFMKKQKSFTFYHYTSWENFVKICETRKFKLSRLGYSNDPFEFIPPFESTSEKKKWDKYRNNVTFTSISLSTKMSSPPMWAHYAKNHTGVCIAFSLPLKRALKDSVKEVFHLESNVTSFMFGECIFAKMIYSNNSPAISYDSNIPLKDRFIKAIYEAMIYKADDWKYENEFKLFVKPDSPSEGAGNLYYADIVKYISGVIIGTSCQHNTREAQNLLKPLKLGNVKVVKAQKDTIRKCIKSDRFKDTDVNTVDEWNCSTREFYDAAIKRGLLLPPKKTTFSEQQHGIT